MHIELRKLAISKALSEATTAYTAEIWINGIKAFAASNLATAVAISTASSAP